MTNLDDTPDPAGGGPTDSDGNGEAKPTDPRVQELEREVARLKGELAALKEKHEIDRALLGAYFLEEFPETEEELLRLAKEARPFKELLEELFQEVEPGRHP